jgi:hypothetical protein
MGVPENEVSAHVGRYVSHRALAERFFTLEPPAHEGGIVFAFYAALHLVQAYLLTKGERFLSDNHGARRAAMRGAPELRPLLSVYALLQARSEGVRYNPTFIATEATRDGARQHLGRVESVVKGKLGAKGVGVP